MKQKSTHHSQRGFTLPVILLIGVGLMIAGLSLMQATSSIRNSIDFQYQQRENSLAAEAGVVYAHYCLSNNNFAQTWNPTNTSPATKPLTQRTDCSGDVLASAPAYLSSNGTRHTSFSIGNLELREDGAILVSSIGKIEQTRGASTIVAQSQENTRKQVVKWKQFKPSISSSGLYRTCGVITGDIWCWGDNGYGQLGDGSYTDSTVPVKVVEDPGVLQYKLVTDLTAYRNHNCAIAAKKVYCWGQNNYGQLGDGTTTNRPRPIQVNLPGDALAIGGNGNTSCAVVSISNKGKIYCWGENTKGGVGIGTTGSSMPNPTAVTSSGFTQGANYSATTLSTGALAYNVCAVVDGDAYCWGPNEVGQIGDGTTTQRNSPKAVTKSSGLLSGKTVISITNDGYPCGQVSTGCAGFGSTYYYAHTCAVAKTSSGNGTAYCWGENYEGQLGNGQNGTSKRSSVPVAVRANSGDLLYNKDVVDIAAGVRHTCALAAGAAYCWGYNGDGQLGIGSFSPSYKNTPQQVSRLTGELLGKTVLAIGAGANRGCAITELNSYCWGLNGNGQLGDGTTTDRSVPTESIYLKPKAPTYIF